MSLNNRKPAIETIEPSVSIYSETSEKPKNQSESSNLHLKKDGGEQIITDNSRSSSYFELPESEKEDKDTTTVVAQQPIISSEKSEHFTIDNENSGQVAISIDNELQEDQISENELPTHSFLKRFTYHDRYRADGGLGSLADHQLKFQATPNRPTKLNFSSNNNFSEINNKPQINNRQILVSSPANNNTYYTPDAGFRTTTIIDDNSMENSVYSEDYDRLRKKDLLKSDFKYDIYDCMRNRSNCFWTLLCPCYVFGLIKQKLKEKVNLPISKTANRKDYPCRLDTYVSGFDWSEISVSNYASRAFKQKPKSFTLTWLWALLMLCMFGFYFIYLIYEEILRGHRVIENWDDMTFHRLEYFSCGLAFLVIVGLGFCGNALLIFKARLQVRKKFNYDMDWSQDLYHACVCWACSICQIANEIKLQKELRYITRIVIKEQICLGNKEKTDNKDVSSFARFPPDHRGKTTLEIPER